MSSFKPSTLVELLRLRTESQPNQTGYTFLLNGEKEETQWTYAELDRQARRIGALLQRQGASNERVLLLYPPGLDFIAAFFGCLYAGAIAVPAYPPRNKRHLPRIQTIIDDSQSKFLLTIEKTQSKIASWLEQHSALAAIRMLVTDHLDDGIEQDWKHPDITGNSLAFLQYTSGSTSLPKGVMVSHENLLHNSALIYKSFEHSSETRVVTWLPPYHDMGLIGGLLQPIFIGVSAVLMAPESFLQRPFRWLDAISKYRATSSGGPNFAYDLCVNRITPEQRQTLDLSCWDVAFSGAEPVRAQTLENFVETFGPCGFRKEAFYPCYGLAESTLFVTGGQKSEPPVIKTFQTAALEQRQVAETSELDEKLNTLVGVGTASSELEVAIVDPETLTRCQPNQIGEIWVSGKSVAQGYWNHPEKTSESFQASLSDNGERSFLRTGDLGFLKDEELFISGRVKDLIIIRGRNHYPQDIEWTLENSHEAIRRNCSAAFSVEINGEERLVAAAEVERRYRKYYQHSKGSSEEEQRRHLPDRRHTVVDQGFSPELSQPPKIEDALVSIRQAIAEYHELQVHQVVLLKFGTIPRTSSGKIQRHACKAKLLDNTLDVIAEWNAAAEEKVSPEPSEKPLEEKLTGAWEIFLAGLWENTLEVNKETLHKDSHFFQLGGDSLNATTLTGLLSDAVGVELETDLVYQYPELSALAAYLEGEYGMPPTGKEKNVLLTKYQSFFRPERPDFPLLPLQQSFFIGRQIGDVAIYVVLDIELQGKLDISVFQKAVRVLEGRHPAMRLAFTTGAEGPIQQVTPLEDAKNIVEYHDVSQLSEQEAAARLQEATSALTQYTFNNDAGETFHAKLFTVNAQTHRLLMNFDHLAIDGFSLSKWFEELHTVYAQLLQGQPVADSPQTSLSFKEYIEVYSARQEAEQRERDVAYWLHKIPEFEPFPHIGEPETLSDASGFQAHISILDSELVKQLHEHARTHGLTFFSILMAAFFKLLSLRTDSNRLTINTPHLNRHPYSHDVQDVIGCFTDILPIREDELFETDLLTLAHNVHRSLAEMHRHSGISGVDIARLLAQKQQTTPEALSPIIFSSALFPLEAMSSSETYQFSSVRVQTGAPATFIDVVVYDACDEFICSWNFLRSKFSPEKIASLATQYEAILKDFAQHPQQADPLNTLLGFSEFAAWYQQKKQQKEQERDRNYWRTQLQGFPILQLPTDYPQVAEAGKRRATQPIQLPEGVRDDLQTFSQKWNVSSFITLLTVFKTLLFRYTSQSDIAIGLFVHDGVSSDNILIIRTDLSENPSFVELLKRVQDRCLEAEAHGNISFNIILKELQTEHGNDNHPSLQVLFAYNLPPGKLEEDDNLLDCDLTLSLQETGQGLVGEWHYNAALFEPSSVDRMTGHFQTLLQDAVEHNEKSISELAILTEAERQKILVDWNATETDYPLETCIHTLFEAQVEHTPDAVALVFEEKQLTYSELNRKANQLAHYLRKLGVGPEVFVGISVERSFEMVIGLLGILKAGGAYVPMDPEYPKDRLAFMLEDSQVPVLLTQEKLLGELPEHKAHDVCLDKDWETIAQERDDNPVTEITADNLIYAIYTSGSTGKPKGAMNIHRALCNRILWMQDAYQLTAEDHILQKTPFSFDVSGWEFYWPLITGARLVIAKPGGHKDSAYLVKLIQEQQITTMHFVPPMLQVFLEERGVEQCTCLRQVICSGEALPYELQERFFEKLDADLHNLYGPTEAAIDVTFWQCQKESQQRIVPIGRPIANTQIYILDPYLHPVPAGVPGELLIGGVNLARGYLNRPELTQEKFIPNPLSDDPESRLYRTGDLVRHLPDGNIEYLGRFDHQVKIRGFRIELGEIEAVLASHAGIREVVVLAREDRTGDKRLVAYLVPAHKPEPATNELRDFLKERLPEYMVPSAFVMLDEFPLSPNGKIDRRALPMPEGVRSHSSAAFVKPQTELEQLLVNVWQEMLNIDKVGIHDNFFELGGHSLLAVQIHNKLQELLGLEVSVVEVFQYPTVHSLAKYIREKQEGKPEAESAPARGEKRGARRASMKERRQARQQHRTKRK